MKKSQSKCCDWERFPCVKEGIASAYLNAGGEVAGTLGEMIRKRAYLLQGTASFPGLRGFWKRASSRQKLGKQQGTEQLSGLRGLLTNQPVAAGPQPRMLGLQLLTPPHLRGKRCCARARACECVWVCEPWLPAPGRATLFCILKMLLQGGGSSTRTRSSPAGLRNQSTDLAAGDAGWTTHSSIDLTINQIKETGSSLR